MTSADSLAVVAILKKLSQDTAIAKVFRRKKSVI